MIPVASILQPIEDVAEAILKFFHTNAGLSWGTSIIALTIVVRAVLVPLTFKQIKSMRALQALQPKIKEIQEKYKNDKQRMQQEMMRFYQENKINPLASCLPLILQLPIFFALYRVFRGDSFKHHVEASGEQSWLFINSIIEKPHGAETVVLMVLFAASMAVSTFVSMSQSPTAMGTQQYVMMGAFALMGVFFVPAVPAGLSIYWVTSNIWTVGQGYVVAKVIPAPAVLASGNGDGAAKAPPPPPRKRKRRR